jgi:processive 1,2-diacylglycerol beta-glucosyltransferase
MAKILFLTCSAGTGHTMASNALAEECRRRNIDCKIVDCVEYMNFFTKWSFRKGWIFFSSFVPQVYGNIYKLLQKNKFSVRIIRNGYKPLFKNIKKVLQEYDPDIIINTHPVGAIISSLWKKENPDVFVVAQSTDFQAISALSHPEMDMLCTPIKESKEQFVKWGVDPKKIFLMGPPVRHSFFEEINKDDVKRKFNLDLDSRLVLIARGGIGSAVSHTKKIAKGIAGLQHNVQAVVVSGNNKKMKSEIDKLAEEYPGKIISLGFVDNFNELLFASDIYVCKPGGLSLSEAINGNLPFIAFKAMPGQEEFNVDFIRKNKIGYYEKKSSKVVKIINKVLEDKSELNEFKNNMQKLDKNFSPAIILGKILNNYEKKD